MGNCKKETVSEILLTVEQKTCCNNKDNNCTMLELIKKMYRLNFHGHMIESTNPNTVPYNKSK